MSSDNDKNKGTGDGTVPHVTPLQFWSAIIPLIATSIMLPMWQMWLSSQHETNRANDTKRVMQNQDTTHDELKSVAAKAEEVADKAAKTAVKVEKIQQATSAIAEAIPPMPNAPKPATEN